MRYLAVVLLACVGCCLASYPGPSQCWRYEDHSAKYRLRHDKQGYPEGEVNLVLVNYPYMKDMFYKDKQPHPTAVQNPYVQPLSTTCPYHKFTLYSFYYSNKDCYVVYPDVQQVAYVQCKADNDRTCQNCAYHGKVSKCDEDYEYRYVWAYCTYKHQPDPYKPHQDPHKPHPDPHNPHPDPYKPHPDPYKPKPDPYKPKQDPYKPHQDPYKPHPDPYKPTYPVQPTYPKKEQPRYPYGYPYPSVYKDPWNKVYKTQFLSQRWKRWAHTEPQPKPQGKIERLALYLPMHCGCKVYKC